MKIHFIAIGGAAMHNLAIALKDNGDVVSGSDDEIFEPSLSLLKKHNLLPDEIGWNPNRITKDIDLIILGMHARKDNPELLRAQELGIPINSYPEFIYERSKNKRRVVIAGSHGKTTTTSMVLHVLKYCERNFDFMVGARIKGFDTMVRLSDAPVIILEGDEYFSSPIDMKAKFLWYKPHIALITGIAWDHINVYPTKEHYENAFEDFINTIEPRGILCYYENDRALKILAKFLEHQVYKIPYDAIEYEVRGQDTYILTEEQEHKLKIFGEHNMENLQGARIICGLLNVHDDVFMQAMTSFEGSSNRLEQLANKNGRTVIKDFAHSPSKLRATVDACKAQFSDGKLLSVMELHTFSSLNKEYLEEYRNSMSNSDYAIVYYDPETVQHKKLKPISPDDIKLSFGDPNLTVITNGDELEANILAYKEECTAFLLMSSGKFNGLNLKEIAEKLTA